MALAELALAEQFSAKQSKQRMFGEFQYAAGTWDKARRVIARLEHGEQGANPRFIVSEPFSRRAIVGLLALDGVDLRVHGGHDLVEQETGVQIVQRVLGLKGAPSVGGCGQMGGSHPMGLAGLAAAHVLHA